MIPQPMVMGDFTQQLHVYVKEEQRNGQDMGWKKAQLLGELWQDQDGVVHLSLLYLISQRLLIPSIMASSWAKFREENQHNTVLPPLNPLQLIVSCIDF